ncbi:hypothetical protein [Vreelandella malpeensis]|uniref:Uncharacterized protein n=1 Tax=Vreelandella malpeensis TaxID=1172368 RepID=A0ABS8DV81_9GAMM|nr:hypothetical protein [Halomonas malpeensis]MCB8889965.1 hypothetical protein [Halomonas malpeensis]
MRKPAYRHNGIYIDDPVTGVKTSLSAMAKRHGVSPYMVTKRYHAGVRGAALIEPYNPAQLFEEHLARQRAEAEKRERIFWTNTWGLACPMSRLGDVLNRGEGAQ